MFVVAATSLWPTLGEVKDIQHRFLQLYPHLGDIKCSRIHRQDRRERGVRLRKIIKRADQEIRVYFFRRSPPPGSPL